MSTSLERLKERLAQVADLDTTASVLAWDQQVNMPPGGSDARAHHLATVQTLAHSLFVADETGELLEGAAAETADLPYDSDDASLVRVAQREYDKLCRVPESLVTRRTRAAELLVRRFRVLGPGHHRGGDPALLSGAAAKAAKTEFAKA